MTLDADIVWQDFVVSLASSCIERHLKAVLRRRPAISQW